MQATMLPGRFGRGTMYIPSHAGDGAVGVIWSRHDVFVESCW
jgi:putative AlgH/UPF0301 family transcriptional regulator